MGDITRRESGIFDEIRRLTSGGIDYWLARELQGYLGYPKWEDFEGVIARAIVACDASGVPSSHQFRVTTKMVQLGSGAKRGVKDFQLSRYACYLVAMNSDPAKAKVALAQSYFAVQTRRQELADSATEDEKRMVVRERVRESNIQLNKTAAGAGVKNYAFFHDAGYRGMYGMSQGAVKRKKGIDAKEDFLDCVGRLELAANEFRITLADERLRVQNTHGQEEAEDVHREVGRKVRNTVKQQIGRPPETLPRAESIKKIANASRKALKGKKG